MVNFKHIYCVQYQLESLPVKHGQFIVITDRAGIYVDIDGTRYAMQQIDIISDEERTGMLAPIEGLYFTYDTFKFWYYKNDWQEIGNDIDIQPSEQNGYIKINGEDVKVYELPALTKDMVGLGNVPNVTTNNQTPTFNSASSLQTLISGETLTISFGKIKFAIDNLINHLSASNPHNITKVHVGLSKVENKSPAEILATMDYDDVVNALGYAPPTENTTYGIASTSKPGLVLPSAHVDVNSGTGEMTVIGGTADKLKTSRKIALTGDVTGEATFNGSADATITASIPSIPASKVTGVLSIANIPHGALERVVQVENETARFALTTEDVQLGDTVKQLDTGLMYVVIDESKLNNAGGYMEYVAGSAASVPWTGVTGKPSTFTPTAHQHVVADITDFPDSMPASDVYAWAKAQTKPTYTKAEIGLSNVENKSAATILGEMTSKNVTDALGYTPIKDAYVHPEHTAYAAGLYKVTVDELGHVTLAAAVTKSDILGLGITEYSLPVAGTALGGIKSGGDITVDGDGNVTVGIASKLRTAVKIGNADFDGSKAISLAEIGVVAPSTLINDSAASAATVYSSQKTEATYAKKSSVVDVTLSSTQWVGEAAPYTYTIEIIGVTATNVNEIIYSVSATDEQIKAYQSAGLRDGGQSTGQIILKATAEKPTVDIPITVIVRHDV